MAKTMIGVDFGQRCLKLAWMNGEQLKKTVVVNLPDQLMRDGRFVSIESAGEFLREAMKEAGIRGNQAAVTLAGSGVFVREVEMPKMTESQLLFNLPYEFKDYISDELKKYVYDYAVLNEGQNEEETMKLMAVAVNKEQLEEYQSVLRKAGLKMKVAAPVECVMSHMIRELEDYDDEKEYCVLDLGYSENRLFMYKGDRIMATKELENGFRQMAEALSEELAVDIHLAQTYLETNYEECQACEAMTEIYNRVAVELVRAINFYRFSNQDSELNDLWLLGGTAEIPSLVEVIDENLNMNIHRGEELLIKMSADDGEISALQAVAVAR